MPGLRRFPALLAAFAALILLAKPGLAAAAEAVAATDRLALRAKPAADARVLKRLPILTRTIILKRAKKWVYVQADYCPDPQDKSLQCETFVVKGWVLDAYLAYDHRFKPVTDWRDGTIKGESGNANWIYDFAADGSFSRTREEWQYRRGRGCSRGEEHGRYCVRTRVDSGRLTRFRNVVRPGELDELLYIDGRGRLCDRLSSAATPMCEG